MKSGASIKSTERRAEMKQFSEVLIHRGSGEKTTDSPPKALALENPCLKQWSAVLENKDATHQNAMSPNHSTNKSPPFTPLSLFLPHSSHSLTALPHLLAKIHQCRHPAHLQIK
jgi:hypothetical protein